MRLLKLKTSLDKVVIMLKIHEMDIPIQQFNYVIEEIIKQSEHSRVLLSISTAERKTVERTLRSQSKLFK